MEVPEGAGWAAVGSALTAAVAGLFALLGKRVDASRSPPAAMASADADVATALGAFVESLGNSMSKHTDHLRDEIRDLRTQLHEVKDEQEAERAHRVKCEGELADVRERLGLQKVAEQLPLRIPGLVSGGFPNSRT